MAVELVVGTVVAGGLGRGEECTDDEPDIGSESELETDNEEVEDDDVIISPVWTLVVVVVALIGWLGAELKTAATEEDNGNLRLFPVSKEELSVNIGRSLTVPNVLVDLENPVSFGIETSLGDPRSVWVVGNLVEIDAGVRCD